MNQNTTIETIREAIGILDCVYDDDKYDRKRIISAAATLCDLANRLEAAPKEKPEFRPIPTKYELAWEDLQERLYRGVDCEAIEIMDEVSKRWLTPAALQQPKEQPPVEQSEPAAEHPLHAGYVIIDGEKRELRWCAEKGGCPNCGVFWYTHEPHDCEWLVVGRDLWLAPAAPPAVIEPEPELECATCDDTGTLRWKGVSYEIISPCPEGCKRSREIYPQFWEAVDQKREIISRKGDK